MKGLGLEKILFGVYVVIMNPKVELWINSINEALSLKLFLFAKTMFSAET